MAASTQPKTGSGWTTSPDAMECHGNILKVGGWVASPPKMLYKISEVAAAFLERILKQATAAGLLSDEHFRVDGTLIEAWASLKSFRPKEGPPPPLIFP